MTNHLALILFTVLCTLVLALTAAAATGYLARRDGAPYPGRHHPGRGRFRCHTDTGGGPGDGGRSGQRLTTAAGSARGARLRAYRFASDRGAAPTRERT